MARRGSPNGHQAKLHDKRLDSLSAEHVEMREAEKRKYNGAGEAEVVLSAQLAPILTEHRRRWNLERNAKTESELHQGSMVMGFLDWLSFETEIGVRRLWGIMRKEYKTVPFSQAEKILMALQEENLLTNGDVRVIPNPNWSLEKWMNYMEERGCI